jgi:hypothetical protein
MFYALLVLMLTPISLIASTNYELHCFDDQIETELGRGTLELSTKLIVNGENDYVLDGGSFSFMIQEEGYNYRWTDQKVSITRVENSKRYRPRVYLGHAKFANFAKDFFGIADFIVPHKDLLAGVGQFRGVFILSWVDDHWGDSLQVDCSLR